MTNEMKIQICRDDFYLMMRNAVLQAGGKDDAENWKKMRLEEVVNVLAQNGIRMVYMSDKHVDSLSVEWKAKPSGRREDAPLSKRKLLCDKAEGPLTDMEFREKYGDGPEAQ